MLDIVVVVVDSGGVNDDGIVEADTEDIFVEAASFDVEEDVSVVVGDNFVVAGKVVGANEDDSRSFPASVSVVEAENKIVK